ncbi:hypothetical protein V6N13_012945 [Hibiscus sabdariffa]|uniref:Uncharacterized protein n=1 Tax=Hibiscus sabdariffa TaxID=183260 RepID=A0ABR2SHB2_9ROSI
MLDFGVLNVLTPDLSLVSLISGKHKIQEMGKKTNSSLGATATATDEAISGASQKKHLRSRKPKFEVGKPKQGFDKKKKDKKKKDKKRKRKRKETAATWTAKQLLQEIRLMKAEIWASHQLVDKFHLILKLGTTRTRVFDHSVGKEKRREEKTNKQV